MEIKNVREPSEEEKKNIIPKLVTFGITTAILTGVIYLMTFNNANVGESMYLAGKTLSTKTALQHDQIIKLFEAIFGRDYMLNKFEGMTISALVSVIAEAVCGVVYKVHTTIKGMK